MTRIHYSLEDALGSVPRNQYNKVVDDLMEILGITSRERFWQYKKGKAVPALDRAILVEKYFYENFKIQDVWKEVTI